ncbi:MAG: homoserine dehydrogenase [Acidobacteriota bacterium]
MLLGCGGVGRALIDRLLDRRSFYLERFGLEPAVVAIADGTGCVTDSEGLAAEVLNELRSWKEAGRSLRDFPGGREYGDTSRLLAEFAAPGTVAVDLTASDETGAPLAEALERGVRVVLANKKPLAGDFELFRRLTRNPAVCRWETTVGSSLPIIASLNRLIAAGDEVFRIVGSYSGTLGFLTSRLQEGARFSRLVRQAFEAGFTEPDPREDLSGVDVARKSLILARMVGWPLELKDVTVGGILPQDFSHLSLEAFFDHLVDLDEYFAVRSKAAKKHGNVLRYVATVERDGCRVGLEEVPESSQLGRLRGMDNLAEIYSRLYDPYPLVLQGRGSGVQATAAGVLADIVELALA